MAQIISFPRNNDNDGSTTIEEYQGHLLDLHERLSGSLSHKRTVVRVKMDIDDILELMQLIEDRLGPDWFSDE